MTGTRMGEPHMAEDADTQVLNAAITIRSELGTLVPADADAFGSALDERIARAQAAPTEELTVHVDEIIEMLALHRPTSERLHELCPFIDTDRGAADYSAFDQLLAGEFNQDGDPPPSDVVCITCQECHYVNKLPFYPTADDPPYCQNPDVSRHLLNLP